MAITQLDVYNNGVMNDSYIVKIDDTHFIVVYSIYSSSLLYARTFSVDANYNMTLIDTEQLSTNVENSRVIIEKIDDTHYILVYNDSSYWCYAKTISIDWSYNITAIATSTLSLSGSSEYSWICKIDSTHFAVSYWWSWSDGYCRIITIEWNYSMSLWTALEFDTVNWLHHSIVLLDSSHLCIAYSWDWGDWFIIILSFNWSYELSYVSWLEHDESLGFYNNLIKIDNTHVILEYHKNSASLIHDIKTFAIDWSYNITETYSTTDYIATTKSGFIKIDDTHYAVAYSGTDGDWFIWFTTLTSYNPSAIWDILEHDTTYWANHRLCLLDSTHMIMSYVGNAWNWYIKTFSFPSFSAPTFIPKIMQR